jgi:hypothetical protein
MNRSDLPAPVLAKLFSLQEVAEDLALRVARAENGITNARERLTGGFDKQSDYHDLRATLNQLMADKPTLEKKLHAAQSALRACTGWLNRLPNATVLEPVELEVEGHDLAHVIARVNATDAEVKALRAIPTPSADIKERIERYVADMGRPQITGLCEGERLKVIWPGAGWDNSGPREGRADVLALMALLHAGAMVDALLREVERMVNGPVPLADRPKRISELAALLETLQR